MSDCETSGARGSNALNEAPLHVSRTWEVCICERGDALAPGLRGLLRISNEANTSMHNYTHCTHSSGWSRGPLVELRGRDAMNHNQHVLYGAATMGHSYLWRGYGYDPAR